ncbi:MAG TPA: hypothetical protein VGE76_24635 [Opitutaceae bacterium]
MKLQELKKETRRLLETLPANADWDDLMYQIYVRKKIDAGLRDSAAGRVATSQQIRRALKIAPRRSSGQNRPNATSRRSTTT